MSTNSTLSEEERKELEEQINILTESQKYLRYIMASVVLSYENLEVQKQQLIDSLNNVNTTTSDSSNIEADIFQRRLLSSALVIEALTFYFNLSKESSETTTNNPVTNNSNKINHSLDGLALFIVYERTIDNIITYRDKVQNPENINLT